jgi:hypothetical protein
MCLLYRLELYPRFLHGGSSCVWNRTAARSGHDIASAPCRARRKSRTEKFREEIWDCESEACLHVRRRSVPVGSAAGSRVSINSRSHSSISTSMLDIIWSSGIITRRPLFLRLTMPFHPGISSPPNADLLLPGRQERQEVRDLPLRKVLRHALLVAAGGVGGVPLTAGVGLRPRACTVHIFETTRCQCPWGQNSAILAWIGCPDR